MPWALESALVVHPAHLPLAWRTAITINYAHAPILSSPLHLTPRGHVQPSRRYNRRQASLCMQARACPQQQHHKHASMP